MGFIPWVVIWTRTLAMNRANGDLHSSIFIGVASSMRVYAWAPSIPLTESNISPKFISSTTTQSTVVWARQPFNLMVWPFWATLSIITTVTTKLIWTFSSRLECKMFLIIKQIKQLRLRVLLVNAVLKNQHLLLKTSGRILYAVPLVILLITFSPITTDTVAPLLRPVALKLFSGLFLTSHLQSIKKQLK